ncbi:MAG: hypothetical protein ACTHKV_03720 [Flavipsychrobacter sp.]
MDTILRSEVLKQIDSGEPFDLDFITANRSKGTGGRWIELRSWVKVTEDQEKTSAKANASRQTAASKYPDHYRHGTLNLRNPGNKALHIVKVHTALMQIFNGKKVING